jgi:hypothetical protein
MTLTRMIPSLRAILPDPLLVDAWPEATVATTTDVVVSGISLLRLVEVCGTPCVHSGAAVIPRTDGRPSATSRTAVLVVRVTRVALHESGSPVVETDARLDDLRLVWSETRLIDRASTAHSGTVLVAVRPVDPELSATSQACSAELPLDIRAGDLLAIPSVPIATSWALRPHPLTGTFETAPRPPTDDGRPLAADQPAWLSSLE